jgi:hypothetical protein
MPTHDMPEGPTDQDRPAAAGLGDLERAWLRARDTRDRLDVARVRGEPADTSALEAAATAARRALEPALLGVDERGLDAHDAAALGAIRRGIETALADDAGLPVTPAIPVEACSDPAALAAAVEAGEPALRRHLEACYGAVAEALPLDREVLTRPVILGRLAREPSREQRRRLFLALAPLWEAVNGDGGPSSPYRRLLRSSARTWASGRSPIEANARALGVTAADIEAWALATLEAWRRAVVEPRHGERIEPWDWWWTAGEAERALQGELPLRRLEGLNRDVYASLGADLDALRIGFDVTPRPGRPPVPVAFTTFGGRPARRPDGTWDPGAPWVLATYTEGGLGELLELVHETGHAIHIAAVRTRPAFADWPDSDALTEALAELVALDVSEPRWQRHWLGPDAPVVRVDVALRGRYADVVLDAAWALLEIRLHADPDRAPNDAWTELTSTYLGIAAHPEWSWWALRGQLVQAPGYMANYAIGAVLATDLRAAIRAARGDWTAGDPGWYEWVRERVYRFGLERPSGEVLAAVLGRPPRADALVAEIERARS